MTESVLIIGYGRAGKRHAKMAEAFGLMPYIYDPYVPLKEIYKDNYEPLHTKTEDDFTDILHQADYGHAIIATPPDSHLRYIRLCLDSGLPVLCEKPLCALGQLDEAKALLDHPQVHRLMVAYNWRYHPKLKQAQNSLSNGLFLDCWQFRDNLPEWGLLLDHCSHDLDILRFVTANAVEIEEAYHRKSENMQTWEIITSAGKIRESVVYVESKRFANLYYAPGRFIELTPLLEMFSDMWQAFLRGDYRPGLLEAIKTQALLEKCHQLNGENNNDLFKPKLDQTG